MHYAHAPYSGSPLDGRSAAQRSRVGRILVSTAFLHTVEGTLQELPRRYAF